MNRCRQQGSANPSVCVLTLDIVLYVGLVMLRRRTSTVIGSLAELNARTVSSCVASDKSSPLTWRNEQIIVKRMHNFDGSMGRGKLTWILTTSWEQSADYVKFT